MKIENRIRENLWKAICAHYERSDYTEAVRDSVFHLSEVLREKGGIEDKDGTKLVETALLGTKPAILINKNETTTEKDIQQGIGFAVKGIMQSVRNPLSHESIQYSQDEAEVLILYINFLLNQIDKSGGSSKIENIVELLMDEDFTDTKEYAELLLKEVPTKKRYDLLVELYQTRKDLPENKLQNFLDALFYSLTKVAKTDFIRVVSTSLLQCKNDRNLRMYIHYFMKSTYAEIDRLAQLRIEDLLLKSVKDGAMELKYDPLENTTDKRCNLKGSLSTWVKDKFELLGNYNAIINILFFKLRLGSVLEQEFVFKYFSGLITKSVSDFTNSEISTIKEQLKEGNELFFYWMKDIIEWIDDGYIELFGPEYEECKRIVEENKEEELPF